MMVRVTNPNEQPRGRGGRMWPHGNTDGWVSAEQLAELQADNLLTVRPIEGEQRADAVRASLRDVEADLLVAENRLKDLRARHVELSAEAATLPKSAPAPTPVQDAFKASKKH